jgi:hypothetical protein
MDEGRSGCFSMEEGTAKKYMKGSVGATSDEINFIVR